MLLGTVFIAAVLALTGTDPSTIPLEQRALLEIKFSGSAKDIPAVETDIQSKVNKAREEMKKEDALIMGPQNFGYSVYPQPNGGYNYDGYVFYEASPVEKGNALIELLNKNGFQASFGQRCGGK